jgi:hypothetical protein
LKKRDQVDWAGGRVAKNGDEVGKGALERLEACHELRFPGGSGRELGLGEASGLAGGDEREGDLDSGGYASAFKGGIVSEVARIHGGI